VVAMASTSIVAMAVCLAFEDPISRRFLDGAPVEIFRLSLLIVPAMVFGRWLVGLCRAIERFDLNNWYRISVVAGTLAAIVVALVVLGGRLEQAVAGLVAANILSTFWLAGVVLRKTGVSARPSGRELRASLRYGSKTHVQAVATQVHEQVDIFMLAALLSAQEEVAFYAVAVGVVNRLKVIPDAVASAFFPRASSLERDAAADLTALASRHAALWVGAMTVGLAVIAPFVVPWIFGSAYAASVLPLLVLLPAMMCMTMATLLSRFFMAFDRQRVTIVVQGVATIANIGLNFVLIPRLGTLGAALASLASYAFAAGAMAWAFRGETHAGIVQLLVVRREDLVFYRKRLAGMRRRLGV